MGGQGHAPAALSPGMRPGTLCTGGWETEQVWTGAQISSHRDLILGSSRTPPPPLLLLLLLLQVLLLLLILLLLLQVLLLLLLLQVLVLLVLLPD